MSTISSWSVPKLDWPLACSRPITSQETLLTRMLRPIGSALPNSSSRTVSPMMQTARPPRTSLSRNWRPAARAPVLRDEVVVVRARTWRGAVLACRRRPLRLAGDGRDGPHAGELRLAGLDVAHVERLWPPSWRGPARTVRAGRRGGWLPSLARSAVTLAVVPLPIVTMAMTAPTPMTMPSTVRNERSALRWIACKRKLERLGRASRGLFDSARRRRSGHRRSG